MRRFWSALPFLLLAACGGDETLPEPATLPESGLYATMRVGDELFRVSITSTEGMAEARAVWDGSSAANIATGELACSAVAWNSPWSWHLVPGTVRFAEATIEVCDGSPSYVQANCATFGPRYCPWGGQMTELRDCAVSPDCPPVPR